MALTEQEQQVVNKSKIYFFSAFLQGAYITTPLMLEKIDKKEYPSQEKLDQLNQKTDNYRFNFDFEYLVALPDKEINPLQLEQEAWKLLSPLVKEHVDVFGEFIKYYLPQEEYGDELVKHLDNWFDLIQKWNIIAESYGAKYGHDWKNVENSEESVKKLIQELTDLSRGAEN